jgi:hypothetical protein
MAMLWLALGSAVAQPLSNLVFTVGTTARDGAGHDWSYVLLGSQQAPILTGKQFAVFGKNGQAADPGNYTQRGTILLQTNPGSVSNLLTEAAALGDNLNSLETALDTLFGKLSGFGGMTLAQKVVAALGQGAVDPSVGPSMLMLARLHVALNLASGLAFAEQITGTTTYETREFDPVSGNIGSVVGRVTITPGNPVVLPAPGAPFQVVSNGPIDHLRIRLRWGTPDSLRRLSLLQFGFNVWRIGKAAAQAGNYDVTPPTTSDLESNPAFKQVNKIPVMATMDYAPAFGPGGPDDPTDLNTFFFSDSNGRSPGNVQFPAGMAPSGYTTPPFNDGDAFYYFVTARDVLGRDGLVSQPGLATACRKNPPAAPARLSVLNMTQSVPLGGGARTNMQYLTVRWQASTNAADLVSAYWIYRWDNPAMALASGNDFSSHLVGTASTDSQAGFASFMDTNTSVPGPSNYWYTVRAVSQTACGPIVSANSAPASGVLRQRAAPQATSGELVGSCGSPVAVFQQFDTVADPNDPDTNSWHYRITVSRRDAGIAWVQLLVGNSNYLAGMQTLGPLYFPPDGNSLSVNVAFAETDYNQEFDVSCVAGTYYGETSPAVWCETTNAPALGQITEAVFQTGELLLTALSSSDPFLAAANAAAPSCFAPDSVTRDLSGTLHMKFANAGGKPVLIRYSTNNSSTWTDLGVATPDTNGVYSAYLCPCVISALPPLQGCVVNLAESGDCDQHVTSAGGAGSVAPINVRFPLTPRTHEYRVYRSVDGGAPTMISQAAALYNSSAPTLERVVTDDAMPPSAARFCYFVQTLDENGNGSPLALIGCKDAAPPKPPRPTMSEPLSLGDASNPQVQLSWFCPVAGIYRFEVRMHQDPPTSGGGSGLSKQTFLSSYLTALPGLNTKFQFYGLQLIKAAVSAYDDWRVTPPISPTFGPGPQFTLTASVSTNATYHIVIAAEDIHGNYGDASEEWTFTWKPPPTNVTVPWPARPVPSVTQFDDLSALASRSAPFSPRVAAQVFYSYDQLSKPHVDPNYPVAIRIGQINDSSFATMNVDTTNFASYLDYNTQAPNPDRYMFKRAADSPDRNGDPLLPIVIYRRQETNASFARVSGNMTQVTPLLESIPFESSPGANANKVIVIPDRLVCIGQETYNDVAKNYFYLRDQQPVILGARYHYYVARFNPQREMSEVIDAGTVDIPTTP